MYSFLNGILGKYLMPVTFGLIAILMVSLGIFTKLYFNELETSALLENELKSRTLAYEELVKQLDEERLANQQVIEAERRVEIIYKEIEHETEIIPIEDCLPAPSPDAVAELLCANGLATGAACTNAITDIID